MRNKAILFVLAALMASCGAGAKKTAFDRYESRVSGVLEEEAALRKQYEEAYADMAAYGREDRFDHLVREKMIPFYAKMEKTVQAVHPEGEELEKIHALLVDYVARCREMFELDTRAAELSRLEKPALDRLNKAMSERDKATRAFNDALLSQPALMQKLSGLFTTEQQAALSVVQRLQAVRAGSLPSGEFLKYLDDRIDPFYEGLVKQLATLKVTTREQPVMLKAKAYVGSTMAFFRAAREIATARPKMLEELKPLRKRYAELQQETTDLMKEYREKARAYRDGIR